MATEEQTANSSYLTLRSDGAVRRGQRLTISNRTVTKLSFLLYKSGSPTGDVTFTIRKVSDDSIINSKVWGNASALTTSTSGTWYEVTFDSPVLVNEEVRILAEFSGGDASNWVGCRLQTSDVKADEYSTSYIASYADYAPYDGAYIYTFSVVAPTVTTQAATNVEATSATGNGNITDVDGQNCHTRGFCYKVGTSGDPTTADSKVFDDGAGSYGTGAYTKAITGLSPGTSYRVRAYAINSGGTGYGVTVQILTKPAAPTDVAATESYVYKVIVTWTKSTGATGYQVYRDGAPLGWLGDVATYDDTGADPPTITPGSAVATDGVYTDKVALSLSGTGINNGTTHTYKVKARNATGESGDSGTDTGYRDPGQLVYRWYKSAGDSDASYSIIVGATGSTYNDTAAPAPTITPGSADASDGAHTDKVVLTLAGHGGNNGAGRYYKCYLTSSGVTPQYSNPNRGYRGTTTLTFQWQRSAADSDADYSNITGGTTNPYDDTEAPPANKYYRCVVSMTGATPQTSSPDRGYRGVIGPLPIHFVVR